MRYLYFSNIFMITTAVVIHYFGLDKPWFLISWFGVVILSILAVNKEEEMDKKIKELENKIEQLEKT